MTYENVSQAGTGQAAIKLQVVNARDAEDSIDAVGCKQRDNVLSDGLVLVIHALVNI